MVNTLYKKYRSLFQMPKDWIYLDGNSLGPLQKKNLKSLYNVTSNEWGKQIIKGWNKSGWMTQPDKIGNQIANLIGADKNTVTVGDSLAIKLDQALSGATQVSKTNGCLLSDDSNFPSDLYIANSFLKDKNLPMRIVKRNKIKEELKNKNVSILMLTHVDYRNGEIYDLNKLSKIAQELGIITVWDLAHSVGALPVNVKKENIDFAVGCTYKYLCGGPGSPAFIYVNPKHIKKINPVIAGWLGHQKPFDFDISYKPAEDIKRFRIGTPPVIQMAILESALKIWKNIDLNIVRKEAEFLTSFFIKRVNRLNCKMILLSPIKPEKRGSQVSFQTDNAYEKMQALIDFNVIGDYREPDIMRFGFNPLYNSEKDVIKATEILKFILKKDIWKKKKYAKRKLVT